MGHPAGNLDVQPRHIRKLDRVVRLGEYRFAQVLADLCIDNVKRSGKLDIANMITAQVDVHQSRHNFIVLGVLVKLHTLNQGGGAITHPNECYPDFFLLIAHSCLLVK